MKYEFVPSQLQEWNIHFEKEIGTGLKSRNLDLSKYLGNLEQLHKAFKELAHRDEKELFQRWVKQLDRRKRLLLPFLLEDELHPEWQEELVHQIKEQIAREHRTFRFIIDAFYQICQLDPLWELARLSYVKHIKKQERRMDEAGRVRWREYLLNQNPIGYLSSAVLQEGTGFTTYLQNFYLSEYTPFYKAVFYEAVKEAKEPFYHKEEAVFRSVFFQATNQEHQHLANHFIRNCDLDLVSSLATLLYDQLNTYRQKPLLWQFVGQNEKDKFAQWILRRELKNFFAGVNQEHERYQYWEKFIGKLKHVVVLNGDRTILMYFSDVVVMEVLGSGAVYVYSIATFDQYFQPKIDEMNSQKEKAKTNPWTHVREVRRSELMDKNRIVHEGWLTHNGGWQNKFDNWLRSQLGWEVNRYVLLQKETK
ncbi:hypothetical protein SAMN04487897_103353 [Paenibacillus sp. yr247]|uniref:hypothetical protein n=1 Tax=Paenibacillus sp. yr247 TaxID=1761880 RepID=UPI0008854FA7|nr:hypothetical protein [Paenibacillus sp. yr247]SDN61741.1 hypothetical protein SAMN04487897_103353 [Paenibacillus sp. yr247]